MRAVRLDAIQVMRLFAALLVVFDHTCANLMADNVLTLNYSCAFRSGGFGVYVFFLISGFVMAHSMYEDFGKPRIPGAFIRRRLIRIVPMYWLVTLVLAAKAIATARLSSPAPIFMSLGFFPYMAADGQVQPINGVGWTLNYEMQFYFIFVLCLFFSHRIGLFLLSAILILLVYFSDRLVAAVDAGLWKVALKFWTDPILLLFLVGVWVGELRAWLERRWVVRDVAMNLVISSSLMWIVLFEVLLYVDFMPVWLEVFFAVALVTIVGMINCAAGTPVSSFLKLLGDASYSIYLVHLTIVLMILRLVNHLPFALPAVVIIVIALISASLSGLVAYKLVEQPMLGFFKRRAGSHLPPAPVFRAGTK